MEENIEFIKNRDDWIESLELGKDGDVEFAAWGSYLFEPGRTEFFRLPKDTERSSENQSKRGKQPYTNLYD